MAQTKQLYTSRTDDVDMPKEDPIRVSIKALWEDVHELRELVASLSNELQSLTIAVNRINEDIG